ncbi:OsmC family protein [Facklamia hominis]
MKETMSLSFPCGLVTKTEMGDFTLITDYPEDRGGTNIAFNPWRLFLASILTCQGVNLAKYCREHNLDYSKITIKLESLVEDNKNDPFPEYHLMVEIPEDFPKDQIKPMTTYFNDCPVVNHLTKLNPIIKTYMNNELISVKERLKEDDRHGS